MRNIEFRTWYRNQPLGDANEAESVGGSHFGVFLGEGLAVWLRPEGGAALAPAQPPSQRHGRVSCMPLDAAFARAETSIP
jgi:hypothetical protein